MAKDINIGGRLHSIATGNIVAGADEILDDNLGKKQTQINAETYSLVESVNNALDALNPDQQEALAVAAKANANEAKLGYYVCDTDADTADKTIAATGYVLTTGGNIRIKMANANTADAVTLNINNTGARALFYNGAKASSTNSWEAGEVVEVYYDGTQFMASNSQGSGNLSIIHEIDTITEYTDKDVAGADAIQDVQKMLLSINNKEYPLRETLLPTKVYNLRFNLPSSVIVLGREKYDNPIEIIGMRIYETHANTINVFIYDTVLHKKTVEKTVEVVARENVIYFNKPHILQLTEVVGMEGAIAGYTSPEGPIGYYHLDLQTGIMTAEESILYGFSVIYRSGGESESSSVLYAKDFSNENNDRDFIEMTPGTIVKGNSGITLSTNDYIYLNRLYACDRTHRIICTLYASSVLKLGVKNHKTNQVTYIATIDCTAGSISIGDTTSAFTVSDSNKYVIDLIKDDDDYTLRVANYYSGSSVEVSNTRISLMDFPVLCLTSGTSPIIEAYAVYAKTSTPYIMFFGDSITDGAQTPIHNGRHLARFSDMIGKKVGKPYITSGRNGGTIAYITDDIIGRLFTEAKILQPKYAFITIGTNGGNAIENLSTLVKKMEDYGVTVILNNVPTRTYKGKEVDITETNDMLQEIRNTFALEGVKCEIACSVNNDGVTTDTDLFGYATGGYVIHPNGEGHYQIYLRTFIDCPDIYTNAGVYPVPDIVPSGTTAERPTNATLGTIYYDTTLDCHVWSTGEETWMNKNGSYV